MNERFKIGKVGIRRIDDVDIITERLILLAGIFFFFFNFARKLDERLQLLFFLNYYLTYVINKINYLGFLFFKIN